MKTKILNLLGLVVVTFLLGLYSAKQFKYGEPIDSFDWAMAFIFFTFMVLKNLANKEEIQ